ncbi:hypothetical protein NMG60_11001385 [Bertholletia excelsa]
MEPSGGNGLPGGIYSNMGSGMLGLEMSLQHHPHQPQHHQSQANPQNPHQLQQNPHPQMVNYGQNHDQSLKQPYLFGSNSKPKSHQLTLSDEEDPGITPEDSAGDNKRKGSPWQRMKWTDGMVRLLITVVFYIGDEAAASESDPAAKKKAGGSGVLQKKGKWKSVSRAMMERGFYVSPQQCEDKFNDLNKRYKRVNDILGKGTACRVVENPNLLDTMEHLSPKRKEEVKKLLSSKHLFFREMCAYHSSCGGAAGGSGAHHSPEEALEPSQRIQHQNPNERCSHLADSNINNPIMPNSGRAETEGSKMAKGSPEEDGEDEEEDEEEDDDDVDDEEDEDETFDHENGQEDEGGDEKCPRKRPRKGTFTVSSPLFQQFSADLISVVQDGTKSLREKGQWIKAQLMQLEEQKMSFQVEAFEIEKQRLKWVKFSSKKEREMERDKLKNERMRLENDRMVLLLRQKELEVLDLQQPPPLQLSPNKRSEPSSITG